MQERRRNDIWDILYKVNQIVMPLVLAWSIWVTKTIFEVKNFMAQGDRFSTSDGIILRNELKDWVRSNYPPIELKADVKEIKEQLEELRLQVKLLINEVGNVRRDSKRSLQNISGS